MDSHPAHRRSGTGKIADRVFAVSTPMVSFYVYSNGTSAVCIDSGSSAKAAKRGLGRIGIDPASVTHVFLTHSDGDHVGGVAAFPNARILLPRAEEPMVSGLRKRRILFLRRRNRLRASWVAVDDGEVVMAGGIVVRVIATPGHTVGSTSYLLNDETLFTGDLLMLKGGRAEPSLSFISDDAAEDARSITRLAAAVPAAAMLCTAHSGYTTDYSAAMAEWRRSGAEGAPR
jgi:hydroxyacylglutathione hydrolase